MSEQRHVWIVGERRADRLRAAAGLGEHTLVTTTHGHLRGPYTGVDTLLRALLPDAHRRWPDLVERHRIVLLHAMPHLAALIGPPPATIANSSPFEERTRFYHAGMIRPISHGIVTFLLRYTELTGSPLSVVFDDADSAEVTTQEFLALLVRRADPGLLRVVVCGTGVSGELADELARHAVTVTAPSTEDPQRTDDPVAHWVNSDGTSDDPAELAAYLAADPEHVRRLHDRRAELLAADEATLPVGALAFHREHGSDPGGAGREALLRALRYCVSIGFSAAIVDLGERGRAVTDPLTHERDFCEFTMQAVYAKIDLGHPEEGLELCRELRRRYATATLQMSTSYAIAMLHTRFFTPRDHEAAIEWQHNAIAIARLLPESKQNAMFVGFQDNALALIEMHRGNLAHALDLVQSAIDRLDATLAPDEWVMHRTQLLHNRARLYVAMRRPAEAHRDYARLLEIDPYYTEYLTDRARMARKRGDLAAALADYDRAIELAPPFLELYYNRGTARLSADDVDGALADFGYALDMEPGDVDTRVSLAETLLALDDHQAASACVQAGLDLAPAEPRLLCMLGTIAVEGEDNEAAIACFDAALRADPEYPAALVNRAVARFRSGTTEGAIDDLTAALLVTGQDPDVLLNRGQAYLTLGQADLALADFDAALTMPDADIAELRYHRGRCLLEHNRLPEAETDLRECLRLGEHADEIHGLLAHV